MTWARGGEEVTGTMRRHWAGKGVAGLASCSLLGDLGEVESLAENQYTDKLLVSSAGVKECVPLYQVPVPCRIYAVQVSGR